MVHQISILFLICVICYSYNLVETASITNQTCLEYYLKYNYKSRLPGRGGPNSKDKPNNDDAIIKADSNLNGNHSLMTNDISMSNNAILNDNLNLNGNTSFYGNASINGNTGLNGCPSLNGNPYSNGIPNLNNNALCGTYRSCDSSYNDRNAGEIYLCDPEEQDPKVTACYNHCKEKANDCAGLDI